MVVQDKCKESYVTLQRGNLTRAWKCNFPSFQEIMTDGSSKQPTDMRGNREVTLPIRKLKGNFFTIWLRHKTFIVQSFNKTFYSSLNYAQHLINQQGSLVFLLEGGGASLGLIFSLTTLYTLILGTVTPAAAWSRIARSFRLLFNSLSPTQQPNMT